LLKSEMRSLTAYLGILENVVFAILGGVFTISSLNRFVR
jgi:hypothetical protein